MKHFLIIFCCLPLFSQAQVLGGERTMEFLRLSQSAHVTAMGGLCVNNPSKDVSLVTANPALLRNVFHGHLGLNYNSFYAQSKFMSAIYAHQLLKSNATIGFAIQYLNHGSITATDAIGNVLGKVQANEFSLQLTGAKQYKDNFRVGTTLKYANSHLADKTAAALLADVGITYSDTVTNWYFGGVFKNAGIRLKNYEKNISQPLPFDLQLGVMKKFNKAPFSIYAIAHHLYTWNIRYNNLADETNNQLIFGDTTSTKKKNYFADKLFRHVNVGIGVNLGKRIEVNVGYNHLRRTELGLSEKKGLAGFSMGITLLFPKIIIQYTRASYHLAGAQNEVGVNLKLDKLFGFGGER
jgi:hypothetical protein